MKDLLTQKVQWHYLINVAGQAYPLRTPEEMVDILRIYNGINDIEGIYDRRYRDRYSKVCYWYSDCLVICVHACLCVWAHAVHMPLDRYGWIHFSMHAQILSKSNLINWTHENDMQVNIETSAQQQLRRATVCPQ